MQLDFNDFSVTGLDGAAHKSGFNGQFAVTAINENTELHAARTPMVEKRVHGGADSAAGIKHVVQEDHVFVHNISSQRRSFFDHRAGANGGKVVAIQSDIQGAYRHGRFFNLLNQGGEA